MKRYFLTLFFLVVSITASAAEADILTSPRASQRPASAPREAEIGIIMAVGPGYLGAKNSMFKAGPYVEINFGNGVFFGQDGIGYRSQNHGAFSVAASLGASRSRREQDGSADSNNLLTGMGDVSPRAQANLFGNYDSGPYHVSAWYKRELGNRNGVEFELAGLYDAVSSGHDLVQLYAGLDYVNQTQMQTFFGVTASQASSSGNPVFTPDAGVAGSGAGVLWRHDYNRNWVGTFDAGAIFLGGSAADSPLTARKLNGFVVVSVGYRL